MRKVLLAWLLILALVVTACSSANEAEQPSAEETASSADVEQAEAEKQAAEEAEAKAKADLEAAKAAEEQAKAAEAEAQAAADQAAAEKAEAEKLLAEAKTAEEKAAAEALLAQKVAAEQAAKDALAKAEAEKVAAAKAAAAKAAAERAAAAKAVAEKAAAEKAAAAAKANAVDRSVTETISILSVFFTPEPPSDSNEIKREIERRTNTKLNITWVSQNNYNEKVAVTLASGNIPDMLVVIEPFNPLIKTMAAEGVLWDLTPYYPKFQNLNALPSDSWNNLKINGKNYGIPRYRPLDGSGTPILRKDWMDKLGLKPPTTMNEMYNVLKAFTEKDPDGNGKNDTVGMAVNVNAGDMGTLKWVESVFNATNGDWRLKNGELLHTDLQPETRDAILWMKKAYDDGIISKDFATLKNTQLRDLVKASRAGGWFDAMNPTWLLTGEMRRTNPAADLLALTSLEGPNGKYTQRDPGNYGMIVIPKRVNEKKLMRILDFMDYGATEEGWVFANFGQEGVHHNLVDGIRIFTDAGTKAVAPAGMLNFYANLDKYARAIQVGIPPDFYKRNRDIIDQRAKISIPDYAYGLQSDTWDKLGKEYLKKATDLKVKIILGMEPIDAWDAYVKQLKTDPDFQKIIKEINTSYKKK